MTQKDIINAWAEIRKTNNSIPDDVLDFMKDAALTTIYKTEIINIGNADIEKRTIDFGDGIEAQIWCYEHQYDKAKTITELIATAVNACKSVNAENPLAVAKVLPELFALLETAKESIRRAKFNEAISHGADYQRAMDFSITNEEVAKIEEVLKQAKNSLTG